MKQRIALVINKLSGGGAERTVSNLSIGLDGTYDVDIVINNRTRIDYPFEGRIISLQMPPVMERLGVVYQLLAVIRRSLVLRKLKRSGEYAAVVSFSELTNLSNILSGNKYAKVIASVRNSISRKRERGLKQRLTLSLLMPFLCRKADLIVSCSKEIADDLAEHYGLCREKSTVIYNGLDLHRIRRMSSEPLSESDAARYAGKKLIVSIGRLTRQKGQWHLLKAVKKLNDDGLPVHLLLLGEGELRPLLEAQAEKLGLLDCVELPGFVKNPYQYMARADVFVLPSLYEGFSNAVLEALACGVPVISSDHETGAREILAPDTDYKQKVKNRVEPCEFGILVPVCDGSISEQYSPEEILLADAIKMVLSDCKLAEHYGQAALKRAEQLDLDSICRQWINVMAEG